MSHQEDAEMLRTQALALLEQAKIKDQLAADEAAASAAEEETEAAELQSAESEAERYVFDGFLAADGSVAVKFDDGELASLNGIFTSAITKARADGARQQRAIVRHEAAKAHDHVHFMRWVASLE